jgi:hypothetical protein
MRKQIVDKQSAGEPRDWLDVEALARVELTSEDPAHPVEAALRGDDGSGWRAEDAGTQIIRLLFDEPLRIRRIRLWFQETETPRTQEFVLRWRSSAAGDFRQIVRQQYNFSPQGTTEELEEYNVALEGVTELELTIVPDIGGAPVHASLAQLRLG